MDFMNNSYDSRSNNYNNNYNKASSTTTTSPSNSLSTKLTNTPNQSSSISLEKDTTFKGTITDIRQKEVTIQLEDGSKMNAKITNPSSLAIGEKAEFKVVYQSEQMIGIEVVSENQSAKPEPTIIKALLGANLPLNDKNQLIVKELLDCYMSIDKQSIQNLMKESYKYPDVSIHTLTLMSKFKLPITAENIRQFNQYQNLEHRIMNGVTSISKELPIILDGLLNEENVSNTIAFHNKLTDFLLQGDNISNSTFTSSVLSNKEMSSFQSLEKILNSKDFISNTNGQLPLDEISPLKELLFSASNNYLNSDTFTTNFLNTEERIDLIQILSTSQLTEEDKASILDGSYKLNNLLGFINEALTSSTVENKSLLQSNLLQKMIDSIKLSLKEQGSLSSILNEKERNNLYEIIKELPLSDESATSLKNGNLTSKELLQLMNTLLKSFDDSSQVHKSLLSSNEYQKILQESLISKWSLTPKLLKEEGSVQNLYQTITDDMDKINNLLNLTNSSKEQVTSTVNNLKENLDFMKSLNEMFTYVQLPVKLQNQNLHSDLYIYTNKKNLKEKKGSVSVLLHLDMEHLGPTDIHLTLENSNVSAKFYLSDQIAKDLIESNMEYLESALLNKGYQMSSEITMKEKEVNVIDDLLEHDFPSTSIKRYSFDIRT